MIGLTFDVQRECHYVLSMARPRKGAEKHANAAIGVRVPEWIKAGAMKVAEQDDKPYSDIVVEALGRYLKSRGIKEPAHQ